MKPSEKELKEAQEALDNMNVPSGGRFYRYIDNNGKEIEVKTPTYKPTIGSLFPCLRGSNE